MCQALSSPAYTNFQISRASETSRHLEEPAESGQSQSCQEKHPLTAAAVLWPHLFTRERAF